MISAVAGKGLDVAQNLGTHRVIGYSRSVTRTRGKRTLKSSRRI
jgi:hypothetical protein